MASWNLVTVGPETKLIDVARTMVERGIRRIAVVRAGQVIGVVSARTIVREFANRGDAWRDVEVGRVSRPPVAVSPDLEIRDVARVMARLGIGSVLVEGGGIVTERDLVRAAPPELTIPAAEVGTSSVSTLPSNATVRDAAVMMIEMGISHVPIVGDGTVIGMVSLRDVLKALISGEMDAQVEKYASRGVVSLGVDARLGDVIKAMNSRGIGSILLVKDSAVRGIVTEWDVVRVLADLRYAYILVKVGGHGTHVGVKTSVLSLPRIISANFVFGPYDLVVVAATESAEKLFATVAAMRQIPGVVDTITMIEAV